MAFFRRTTTVLVAVIAAATAAACGPQRATTADPTAGPSASAEPSATPSPSAAPSVSASAGTDGRLDAVSLTAVMVTVPKWSGPDKETAQRCPSGRLKLAPANAPEMLQAQLVSVVYANLDADAALETAALVKCQYGEASEQMVIAFDRDKAGAVVALGKVAEGHIWTVVPAKSGVTVDISDTQACCDMSKDNEFHQSRTYAWVGSAFRQTAGPTSWAGKPYVTDLVLSTSSLVFGPVVNGRRTGTVTVKVSNAGPAASGRYDVSMSLANATTSSKYLRFADEGDDCPRECHAPLGKGSSIGFTFTVSIAAADLTVTSVKLFVHAYGVQHPGSMADLNYANNSATADVRLS